MKITYNESIKTEVMKELKKFAPTSTTMFIEFDAESNTGIMRIQGYKDYYNTYIHTSIEREFNTQYHSDYSKIVISDLELNDVLLSMLLDDVVSIECHCKNLDNIRFVNVDCAYWIDTIIVKNKSNKKIKHDKMSFNNVQMIYKW